MKNGRRRWLLGLGAAVLAFGLLALGGERAEACEAWRADQVDAAYESLVKRFNGELDAYRALGFTNYAQSSQPLQRKFRQLAGSFAAIARDAGRIHGDVRRMSSCWTSPSAYADAIDRLRRKASDVSSLCSCTERRMGIELRAGTLSRTHSDMQKRRSGARNHEQQLAWFAAVGDHVDNLATMSQLWSNLASTCPKYYARSFHDNVRDIERAWKTELERTAASLRDYVAEEIASVGMVYENISVAHGEGSVAAGRAAHLLKLSAKLDPLKSERPSPRAIRLAGREGERLVAAYADVGKFQAKVNELARSIDRATQGAPGVATTAGTPATGDAARYQKACDGGDVNGCADLGFLYAMGRGVPQDQGRAASLYRKACDGGGTLGCNNLAFLYREGLGVSQDHARAASLYRKSCEAGDATGCSDLGYLYDFGRGVPQDHARAAGLYRQACDAGNAMGCTNLGILYRHGRGVPQDHELAASLYRKACDRGNAGGCNNLGILYRHGHGVPQDYELAASLYRKACDGGDVAGCNNLGILYKRGHGVPQDYGRAASLYRSACDAGDPRACSNLGKLYDAGTGVGQDSARAKELHAKACQGGHQAACGWRSKTQTWSAPPLGSTKPAPPPGSPPSNALRSLTGACERGIASACRRLGSRHQEGRGVPRDRDLAAGFFRKACDGGDAAGCSELAYAYRMGRGVPRDRSRAAKLYGKACDAGHAGSCASLAGFYLHGEGVPQDDASAARLYKRSCTLGNEAACSFAESLAAQLAE